ncbi:hypothetical protein [Rhodoplanes serenus]|uniref:hypothetical protein n=1 Tax=Rhodoplanes serenus TaxID=200615 RepID=UPI0011B949F2|nr:hypothetical protein [Rhodoplanes serenus]
MSAFDYARSRATADRLIARFGQSGAIRRAGAPSGDPWNPTAGESTDHPCALVVLAYDTREIDGTLIRSSDRKVLVAAGGLAVEPTAADRIVIGGTALEIVRVAPLAPGGTVVLYEIQARG